MKGNRLILQWPYNVLSVPSIDEDCTDIEPAGKREMFIRLSSNIIELGKKNGFSVERQ